MRRPWLVAFVIGPLISTGVTIALIYALLALGVGDRDRRPRVRRYLAGECVRAGHSRRRADRVDAPLTRGGDPDHARDRLRRADRCALALPVPRLGRREDALRRVARGRRSGGTPAAASADDRHADDAEHAAGDDRRAHAGERGDDAGLDVAEQRAGRVRDLLDAGEAAAQAVGDRLVPDRAAEDRRSACRRSRRRRARRSASATPGARPQTTMPTPQPAAASSTARPCRWTRARPAARQRREQRAERTAPRRAARARPAPPSFVGERREERVRHAEEHRDDVDAVGADELRPAHRVAEALARSRRRLGGSASGGGGTARISAQAARARRRTSRGRRRTSPAGRASAISTPPSAGPRDHPERRRAAS